MSELQILEFDRLYAESGNLGKAREGFLAHWNHRPLPIQYGESLALRSSGTQGLRTYNRLLIEPVALLLGVFFFWALAVLGNVERETSYFIAGRANAKYPTICPI